MDLDACLEQLEPVGRRFALGHRPTQAGVCRLHVALPQSVQRESRLGHPPERDRPLVGVFDPGSSLQSPQLAELVPGMAGHQLSVDGQVTARLLELCESP